MLFPIFLDTLGPFGVSGDSLRHENAGFGLLGHNDTFWIAKLMIRFGLLFSGMLSVLLTGLSYERADARMENAPTFNRLGRLRGGRSGRRA